MSVASANLNSVERPAHVMLHQGEPRAAPDSNVKQVDQEKKLHEDIRMRREDAAVSNHGRNIPSEGAPAHATLSPKSCAEVVPSTVYALRKPQSEVVRHLDKFKRPVYTSGNSYRDMYEKRLELLRGPVMSQARAQWGRRLPSSNFFDRIEDAKPQATGCFDYVVCGVLMKKMVSRPSVISYYKGPGAVNCTANGIAPSTNLCSTGDTLWLEDTSHKLQLLVASYLVDDFVNGMVVAVRGRRDEAGAFQVTDVCLAMFPMPKPIRALVSSATSASAGPFIAFVSGLNFGAPEGFPPELHSAVRFLLGQCERKQDKQLASAIQWLIVSGGTFAVNGAEKALNDADSLFAQLASIFPVDLMPGHNDPTNASLPQIPLHSHLFRRARLCQDFHAVTNPYECSSSGLHLLGHAGQPVDDILCSTRAVTPLQALEMSLRARHLAPTAPDTLPTPPFHDCDPFVIQDAPHVLFSGGHDKAAFRWHPAPCGSTGTLCLCVPAFHRQPAVILVNMHDPSDVRTHFFDAPAPFLHSR
jgi:DNA polymerase delta subunit 2